MFSAPCSTGNAQPVLMFRVAGAAKIRLGTKSAAPGPRHQPSTLAPDRARESHGAQPIRSDGNRARCRSEVAAFWRVRSVLNVPRRSDLRGDLLQPDDAGEGADFLFLIFAQLKQ
jgi:hypothetical protein